MTTGQLGLVLLYSASLQRAAMDYMTGALAASHVGAFIPCDSWPSHDAGGGFFLDFELFRTASRRVGETAVASMA